jgi:hypothetical protein
MIRRLFLLLVLATPLAAQEEGFTPLFNGKDLAGWVNVNCAPETWAVKDGMIHCDGIPTGALRTAKQYENFILELEWRHLKPGGNAGVFVWAGPLSAPGVPFLRAIEVQVLDHAHGESASYTTHGDVFPIHGSSMKPFGAHRGQRSFPSEKRSKPSPEWNHYRITCQDGVLRLAVNGKEVSGGEECNWRKGYIALESEGGEVDWRNLRVKELPGGKATPEQTAPVADGSVSLYTGRNLNGWTASTDPVADWKAEDWKLKTTGKGGALTLPKKLRDFRLQFDARTDAKGPVSIPLRINGQEIPGARQVTEKWTRYTITRTGTTLTCETGGDSSLTAAKTIGDEPAEISLQSAAPLSVASIYLKE